jgi:hypothetical protein
MEWQCSRLMNDMPESRASSEPLSNVSAFVGGLVPPRAMVEFSAVAVMADSKVVGVLVDGDDCRFGTTL